MANAIIGAIPGYNINIDPNGFYAKKIMSNINRVILTPTGYSLNLGGSIASVTDLITDLVSDESSPTRSVIKLVTDAIDPPKFKL